MWRSECLYKTGLHLWEDAYLLEVIDPDSLRPCAEEETGEIVLTTLQRQATPLLRYRTRDLSHLVGGHCLCGRSHRRLARIKGRSDDMLIVNGGQRFPVADRGADESAGSRHHHLIQVEKRGALDRLDGQDRSPRCIVRWRYARAERFARAHRRADPCRRSGQAIDRTARAG